MTNSEISEIIDNDEGLYSWWKSSRLSKTKFIKENKEDIVICIKNVLERRRPAHYLMYGG
jgi:hypothetical protein